MSADVAVYTPNDRAPLPAKIQYAKMLAESGLLPASYRKQPANVLYAVEYGDMLGLPPMAAITGVHIIEGKPSASAGLISALVRRGGHKLRVRGDDKQAVAQIIRSDDPDFTYEATWTLDRAVTANLCTLKNGKPYARDSKGRPLAWEKYPAAMLKARAITEVARDACEEALYGLHYTAEELGAEVDEEGNIVGEVVAEAPPAAPASAAATTDDPWTAPEPTEADPEWAAVVASAGTFGTDDEGRKLWAAVLAKRNQGQISNAESERLKAAIRGRWKELEEAAEVIEGEIVDAPAGAEPPDLPAADPWAARVEEIACPDDVALAVEEATAARDAGDIDDDKLSTVLAAISVRETQVSPHTAEQGVLA